MKKVKLLPLLLLCFALSGIKAQQINTASGGEASGSGGTASYSVGQVAYSNVSNSNGYINEGVQQPFEFFAVGTNSNTAIQLSYSLFPNPTASAIYLNVENRSMDNLSFQLYDITGKLLLNQKITSSQTPIQMGGFENANYMLTVTDNNKEVQTFKIIKN